MVLHFPANIKSQDGAACSVLRCCENKYISVINIVFIFTYSFLPYLSMYKV